MNQKNEHQWRFVIAKFHDYCPIQSEDIFQFIYFLIEKHKNLIQKLILLFLSSWIGEQIKK